MLADHEITRDELFAVGATFTLVAWGFAYVYVVCQAIEPGSFIAAIEPEADRTWMELLFLSFTTLSSTGLSDVVPVQPFARSARDDRAARGRGVHRGRGLPARGPDDPAARVMDGFGPKVFAWFKGLERDNTREYFTSTRDFYEDKVQRRDCATKDKSPSRRTYGIAGRLYVALSAEGLYAGTGYYRLEREQLERYRDAVDEDLAEAVAGRSGPGWRSAATSSRPRPRLSARPSADRPAAAQAADRGQALPAGKGISGERALAHARGVGGGRADRGLARRPRRAMTPPMRVWSDPVTREKAALAGHRQRADIPSSSSRSISAKPSGRLVSNSSGAQPSPPPIALASASLRHHTRSSST